MNTETHIVQPHQWSTKVVSWSTGKPDVQRSLGLSIDFLQPGSSRSHLVGVPLFRIRAALVNRSFAHSESRLRPCMLLVELAVFGVTLLVAALFLAFLSGGSLDYVELLFLVSLVTALLGWFAVFAFVQCHFVIYT